MVDPRRPKPAEKTRTSPSVGGKIARRTVYTLSEDETFDLGRSLARGLKGGELILLDGELGLGKTVLTRGIAAGLGVAPEDVSSPSFTLIQEYKGGRTTLFHVDLYRLDEPAEFESLGFEEVLSGGGVVVVEWGEKLPLYLRKHATTIRFYDMGEGSRRIELQPADTGPPRRLGDA